MFFGQWALLVSSAWAAAESTEPQIEKQAFTIGETLRWDSEILQQSRTINVYLPASYPQSGKSYPVIYLLDGSADEDFIHMVGLIQFGSFSWIQMVPESILVGIGNVDRKHDFTFPTHNTKDQADFPTTGGSAQFIRFLEQELQPLISTNYRTTAEKTLIGQSLGGLLATEVLFKHPHLFDRYLIVSPSLWWDDESLLKVEPKAFTKHKTVFVAVGQEGPVMVRGAEQLAEKLNGLKRPNIRVGYQYFEQLDHGDTLHLAAYAGLEFLFNPDKPAN